MAGRVHWSFWLIGVISLIWHGMGILNFMMQMDADTLATMPESNRLIAESRPLWSTAAFALAVFGGGLGAVLLLLRKSLDIVVFMASLVGVILAMIPMLGMLDTVNFGPAEMVLAVVMPVVVGVFLIWYAKWTRSRGWIG